MTDTEAGYHRMRAEGATPQEVFRRAVADGREDAIRIIRRVFDLGLREAKEVSLEVVGSPEELAAWRAQYSRPESQATPWDGQYDGKVDMSMLRCPTTLDDYFRRRMTWKGSPIRPEQRAFWERQRAQIEGWQRRGDEVWVWQDGEGMGSCGGLALVRDGEVAHACLHRFS
jgi:hypothetical protein